MVFHACISKLKFIHIWLWLFLLGAADCSFHVQIFRSSFSFSIPYFFPSSIILNPSIILPSNYFPCIFQFIFHTTHSPSLILLPVVWYFSLFFWYKFLLHLLTLIDSPSPFPPQPLCLCCITVSSHELWWWPVAWQPWQCRRRTEWPAEWGAGSLLQGLQALRELPYNIPPATVMHWKPTGGGSSGLHPMLGATLKWRESKLIQGW